MTTSPDRAARTAGPTGVDERADARLSVGVRQLAVLTAQLLGATTTAEVLVLVVGAAQAVLPVGGAVSVTMGAADGSLRTPVWSHRLAVELDQIQYETGVGPCVDAARMRGPGITARADLAADVTWPQLAAAAVARGIGAVLSTALVVDAGAPRAVGALNVYTPAGALDDGAQDVALLLATHATLGLAHAQALSYAELQHARLRKYAAFSS